MTWRQFVCAWRGHQIWLLRGRNRLAVYCQLCAWESDGIDLETWRVRMDWMHQKWARRQHIVQRERAS